MRTEGQATDWTEYSADEAREGLKKINGKKGPRFDFLASPKGGNETAGMAQRRNEERRVKETNRGRVWVSIGSRRQETNMLAQQEKERAAEQV